MGLDNAGKTTFLGGWELPSALQSYADVPMPQNESRALLTIHRRSIRRPSPPQSGKTVRRPLASPLLTSAELTPPLNDALPSRSYYAFFVRAAVLGFGRCVDDRRAAGLAQQLSRARLTLLSRRPARHSLNMAQVLLGVPCCVLRH